MYILNPYTLFTELLKSFLQVYKANPFSWRYRPKYKRVSTAPVIGVVKLLDKFFWIELFIALLF